VTRRSAPLALCTALLSLTLGCSDSTEPASGDLVGQWATAPQDLQPNGWYVSNFTFGADGAYLSDSRSYGVYPGQPRDELSGYTRFEGVYSVRGDSVFRELRRQVTWDRFYGASSPEWVVDLTGVPYYKSGARYELRGPVLILHYLTYPADAPVETTMILQAVGGGW
jgi:hypothetical protein